jgi:hypothetical protein
MEHSVAQGLGQVSHQLAQVSTIGGPLGTGETIVNIEPGLVSRNVYDFT